MANAQSKKATQPASKAAMLAAISKAPGGNAALAAAMAAPASTIATLQAANATPVTAAPAAPVKPAAVAVVAGLINGAPANAPAFMVGGTAYTGALRPHHARQQTTGNTARLPAGSVSITAKGALLKPGGVAYNAMAWQAITDTVAKTKGKATAADLAAAVGNGGAAHVAYRIKGGWLAVAK